MHVESSTGPSTNAPETNLLEYWRVLVERRTAVATCTVVVLVAGFAWTLLVQPMYRATTSLQIERQGPDILTFKDIMGIDPMAYKDYYQTQYKIIQSRAVLRIAVENTDLINNPSYLDRHQPIWYRAVELARNTFGTGSETASELERAIVFLQENIDVRPVRNSHLVNVSVLTADPDFSALLVNAVADAYQEFSLSNRYNTTAQASAFLTREVARVESQVSGIEHELQEYMTEKEILAVDENSADVHEQELAQLNDRLSAAKGRRAVASARFEAVRDADPASLPDVLASQLVLRLRESYAALEQRHAQMAKRFRPDWPELTEVEEQLAQASARLTSEIQRIATQVHKVAEADFLQSTAEVENLQNEVDRAKLAVRQVKRDRVMYDGLRAEIDSRREVLNDLVARESQTESSAQLRDTGGGNIRVVDRAEPPTRPATPRRVFNMLVALLMGVSLGTGGAFLLHYLDNTIKSEEDIVRYAGGAVILGHIPLFQPLRVVIGGSGGKRKERSETPEVQPHTACHVDSRSVFAEAFKNLRTSLLLSSPDHPPRRIVVTSCEPSDGKSTVAANLAIVLTQMGRRVLLIDADLRRPCIHKRFSSPNEIGLSNYLCGEANLTTVVQETEIPGLMLITSGPIPPNPSELLDSPAPLALFAEIERSGYDHVVIDSPPMIQVADSVILGNKADTTLLVVRAQVTSREALVQGVGRFRQSRTPFAGIVLNAVSERTGHYYRYRYYRGDDTEQGPTTRAAESQRTFNKARRETIGQG